MKENKQKISFYNILRRYANFCFRHWFRTIEINGKENVPENEPVILAPNHQNALMDAMALISSLPKPITFMARSDFFRNKKLAKILRALKIIPAYRMRDGYENLKKNESSFDEAIQTLLRGDLFCLMPEGGQEEARTLRPLKKGISRIAFAVQEQLEGVKSVKIVPVGIDYGNYDHSGGHLIVNYGKAINVLDYYDSYKENPVSAHNLLRDELYKQIESLMLNIKSKKYYDCFYITSYLDNLKMLKKLELEDNETNRLIGRQQIVASLQKEEDEGSTQLPELNQNCIKWSKKCKDIALCARASESGNKLDGRTLFSIICLILTFPLFLYSALINGIPYLLIKLFTRKLKGSGFQATLAFGLSAVVFPIFFLLETIVFLLIISKSWFVAAFILSLPISLLFGIRYLWHFKFILAKIKTRFISLHKI